MNRNKGFAQIPLMIALLLMAIAIPAVTQLVQNSQENRSSAKESKGTGKNPSKYDQQQANNAAAKADKKADEAEDKAGKGNVAADKKAAEARAAAEKAAKEAKDIADQRTAAAAAATAGPVVVVAGGQPMGYQFTTGDPRKVCASGSADYSSTTGAYTCTKIGTVLPTIYVPGSQQGGTGGSAVVTKPGDPGYQFPASEGDPGKVCASGSADYSSTTGMYKCTALGTVLPTVYVPAVTVGSSCRSNADCHGGVCGGDGKCGAFPTYVRTPTAYPTTMKGLWCSGNGGLYRDGAYSYCPDGTKCTLTGIGSAECAWPTIVPTAAPILPKATPRVGCSSSSQQKECSNGVSYYCSCSGGYGLSNCAWVSENVACGPLPTKPGDCGQLYNRNIECGCTVGLQCASGVCSSGRCMPAPTAVPTAKPTLVPTIIPGQTCGNANANRGVCSGTTYKLCYCEGMGGHCEWHDSANSSACPGSIVAPTVRPTAGVTIVPCHCNSTTGRYSGNCSQTIDGQLCTMPAPYCSTSANLACPGHCTATVNGGSCPSPYCSDIMSYDCVGGCVADANGGHCKQVVTGTIVPNATATVKPTVPYIASNPTTAVPTKKPGGGGGGGETGCNEQCPGSDGVLRNCTPPESDGTSADSICMAGTTARIESCGGQQFCCPTTGGSWTKDMTKCPTAGEAPMLKFRIAFAGIIPSAQCATAEKLPLSVMVRNNDGTLKTFTSVQAVRVGNTGSGLAYYDVALRLNDFKVPGSFSVFVKGPKHLQMKYGVNNQDKFYEKAGGELSGLTTNVATTPLFHFEKYPLLAGDVTGANGTQDGSVNGLDFTYVKNESTKRTEVAAGGYMLADLNGNCKMESSDLTLLMLSLSVKQGQLY